MKREIIVLTMLIWATSIHAQSNVDEIQNEINNNISHEFVECAAFFGMASEGIRRGGNNMLASEFKTSMQNSLAYAMAYAQIGRTKEMAQKVTLARLEMSISLMQKKIENDFSNISLLAVDYGERCKEVMKNPLSLEEKWYKENLTE